MNMEFWQIYDLAREFRGQWQYRMTWGGKWYCADSKDGAVKMAESLYDRTPPADRKTPDDISREHDEAFIRDMSAQYRGQSIEQLEQSLAQTEAAIPDFAHAAKREMNQGCGRRTSAAVSAEGVRVAGEEAFRLRRFIRAKRAEKGAA